MNATTPNTVFLRLEGPLQSWGLSSRLVVRDTAAEPTKSGVLGLICCSMGLSRTEAGPALRELAALTMGVRIDRPGTLWHDYHTVGAGYGNLSADGRVKITQTTGEYEPVISRRYYLCDASFLVALRGQPQTLERVADALAHPRAAPCLGRRSCPPALPIYGGAGDFATLAEALSSRRWRSPARDVTAPPRDGLEAILECPFSAGALADGAEIRNDVPVSFYPPRHEPRMVVRARVDPAQVESWPSPPPNRSSWAHAKYDTPQWKKISAKRRIEDHDLCVFCKQPARNVHHVSYALAGQETTAELRSLCRLCHDAVTMVEYGLNMGMYRIDPCDPRLRKDILRTRDEIRRWRSEEGRRRALRGAPDKVRRELLEEEEE